MIQSTVILVGLLKRGNERDRIPLLVEEAASFPQLKELTCFRVVGGFFRPMDQWCIMVFYEGREEGDPTIESLRQHLAKFCQEGRTYEHIEAAPEPLLFEASPNHPGGAWIWETRICYYGGSIYRLKWDDLVHYENEKRYALCVDEGLRRLDTLA
ncbi:hypothetical protein N7523_005593 [Penicillium sp. IBT 18751x]|nr:hypothetical protein N7523_005820 [Penicillium sp. IBT 18751x]KAJ6117842.1 hypothetical protein N7523_005593 [Penicillium sp. IBT 18751x]